MLIIGLTGQTGAGKGTVSAIIARYGIPVVDTDATYHRLLLPPSACLDEIVEAFGTSVLSADGTLSRADLAKIVFADNGSLQKLDKIAHKHILTEVKRLLRQHSVNGEKAVVVDAPQLFESGFDKQCDCVISVLADESRRLERICARDGISREQAQSRIDAQFGQTYFENNSDYLIDNNGTPEALDRQVENILRDLHLIVQ